MPRFFAAVVIAQILAWCMKKKQVEKGSAPRARLTQPLRTEAINPMMFAPRPAYRDVRSLVVFLSWGLFWCAVNGLLIVLLAVLVGSVLAYARRSPRHRSGVDIADCWPNPGARCRTRSCLYYVAWSAPVTDSTGFDCLAIWRAASPSIGL